MRHLRLTLLLGLTLSAPAVAQSGYYRQDPQRSSPGYQGPVVRDGSERGYQRGREDEARQRFNRGQTGPYEESRRLVPRSIPRPDCGRSSYSSMSRGFSSGGTSGGGSGC